MSDQARPQDTIPPVVKRLWVPLSPDAAFRLFTAGATRWWPLITHSVFGEEAQSCHMEPYVGGRFYEVHADGRQSEWGRMLLWEPPYRLALSFCPGRAASEYTELELVFAPEAGGSRLVLGQGGWERRGVQAQAQREAYDQGWDEVLQRYLECASACL